MMSVCSTSYFCAPFQQQRSVLAKPWLNLTLPNRLRSGMLAYNTSFTFNFKNGLECQRSFEVRQQVGATEQEWTDEMLTDQDEDHEDAYVQEEEAETEVGDGGDGGGVVLAGTTWGSHALAIAEDVMLPFKDDLEIFAFRVSSSGDICIRLDKLSDKYGSPSIDDIGTFTSIYAERLDEAKKAGIVPQHVALEVSSPGAERIVRVPQDLERFKDLPMYVRYMEETTKAKPGSQEQDGIFQLDNIEMELGYCIWRLANVRLNRELFGKGRSLNKKQRDWRLRVPFTSLVLVRLYLDI
eukprot:Gb_19982 [translate_table: standard]